MKTNKRIPEALINAHGKSINVIPLKRNSKDPLYRNNLKKLDSKEYERVKDNEGKASQKIYEKDTMPLSILQKHKGNYGLIRGGTRRMIPKNHH